MDKVIGCVDGAQYTASVCDYAAWAAQRLSVPLEFLHALDRHPERAQVTDFSGSIGLGTHESLLEELGALDEKRSAVAQRHGREVLDAAVTRAKLSGLSEVESRQRHGALVDSMLDLEPTTRLFVMGQHHHAERSAGRHHLDHNVERAIRALQRPVLVASAEFQTPRRFAIAFDGSATGRKMVETVAGSPMLKSLACDVVMSAEESPAANQQLRWAQSALAAAGIEVQAQIFSDDPEVVLPGYITRRGVDLLVMGAYGHSRIRHLIVGSTTTTLLRTSPVPVLILR
jgi:nucleotide-binding universal stress UspA family protein